MSESEWSVFFASMLFTVGLQIIGRDWPFWTRLGALLIVAPLGTLVGLCIVVLNGMVK